MSSRDEEDAVGEGGDVRERGEGGFEKDLRGGGGRPLVLFPATTLGEGEGVMVGLTRASFRFLSKTGLTRGRPGRRRAVGLRCSAANMNLGRDVGEGGEG